MIMCLSLQDNPCVFILGRTSEIEIPTGHYKGSDGNIFSCAYQVDTKKCLAE